MAENKDTETLPAQKPPNSADGRSRKRPGLDVLREQILNAAMELFAQKNAAELSVENILQKAQVSRQTFYKCFKNKGEILDHVHDLGGQIFQERLREILSTKQATLSPFDALDATVELLVDAGPLGQVFYQEATRPGTAAFARRQIMLGNLQDWIAGWLQQQLGLQLEDELILDMMMAIEALIRNAIDAGKIDSAGLKRLRRSLSLLLTGAVLSLAYETNSIKVAEGAGLEGLQKLLAQYKTISIATKT